MEPCVAHDVKDREARYAKNIQMIAGIGEQAGDDKLFIIPIDTVSSTSTLRPIAKQMYHDTAAKCHLERPWLDTFVKDS